MSRLVRLFLAIVLAGIVLSPALPPVQAQVLINRELEIQLGRAAAADLERRYPVWDDPAQSARLRQLGMRLVDVSDRRDLDYSFKILHSNIVNALALPGGFVYVFEGILRVAESDDELAYVLGHEIGHVVAKHGVKKLELSLGGALLIRLIFGTDPGIGPLIVKALLESGYSRQNELEADRLGIVYMHRAGLKTDAALTMMRKFLQLQQAKDPLSQIFSTHPLWEERVKAAEEVLTTLPPR